MALSLLVLLVSCGALVYWIRAVILIIAAPSPKV
jgi:hypothetical protein